MGDQFQFFLADESRYEVSQQFPSPLLNLWDFTVVTPQSDLGKEVEIFSVGAMSNMAGVAYSFVKRQSEQCYPECQLIGYFEQTSYDCFVCIKGQFLNVETLKCQNFCAQGYRNAEGYCVKCLNQDCGELNQLYFSVEKTGANEFKITQQ